MADRSPPQARYLKQRVNTAAIVGARGVREACKRSHRPCERQSPVPAAAQRVQYTWYATVQPNPITTGDP